MQEIYIDAKDGVPFDDALKLAMAKPTIIHIKGNFDYCRLRIKGVFPDLTIDGHNEAVLYGFEGPFKPFDPTDVPPYKSYTASIDGQNITLKNFEIWGGGGQALSLSNSNAALPLANVALSGMTFRYGTGFGSIFSGGYYMHNVYLNGCKFKDAMYDDISHGVYFSGGHWAGAAGAPACHHFYVEDCEFDKVNGRHLLQFNGRFKQIRIRNNKFRHGNLGAISLIGCRGVKVEENEVYGCHRDAVIVYSYVDDHYFDVSTPEGLAEWESCHHVPGNININHNTFVQGPTKWWNNQWHNEDVNHSVITINNKALNQDGVPDHHFGPISIHDNVLVSATGKFMSFGYHPWEGQDEVRALAEGGFYRNLCWTYGDPTYMMNLIQGNKCKVQDPLFTKKPTYEFISQQGGQNQGYDWSTHKSDADLRSEFATSKGVGKTY